ncbi:MAG: c-type cytochrome [Saprospiraceae bacterium]
MVDAVFFPVLGLIILSLVVGVFTVIRGMDAFAARLAADPDMAKHLGMQFSFLKRMRLYLWMLMAIITISGASSWFIDTFNAQKALEKTRESLLPQYDKAKVWEAPDPLLAKTDRDAQLIAYGRDLVAHTQDYFGEQGLVRPGSINGMNCQNCHLEAGSKPFGNNYFAVQSTYPQMRARSGSLETIPKRVNDCFQRSLNGQPLDTTSREMLAILAYIRWLGTGIPKGEKPKGAGLVEPAFLKRPADPARGRLVYEAKCASCHGADGQGLPMPDSPRSYPPLWGDNSYNEGAGLFRLSRFAGYVKANMPFGANYLNPQLTDEESWDVAAFVNTQPRPGHPFLNTDWPKIAKKPFDHPFGPFADTFPEAQHKFGPFEPIIAFYAAAPKK